MRFSTAACLMRAIAIVVGSNGKGTGLVEIERTAPDSVAQKRNRTCPVTACIYIHSAGGRGRAARYLYSDSNILTFYRWFGREADNSGDGLSKGDGMSLCVIAG